MAFPITLSNYDKTQAVTGAVIFGYLHKDFWRKVKKRKSVQIKGSTYNFPHKNFNFKRQQAPVSVIGAQKIFSISIATASRLKSKALLEGYINVKKNYDDTNFTKDAMKQYLKLNDMPHNIKYIKGKYRLQLIDTIYPKFYFIKRTNLKT